MRTPLERFHALSESEPTSGCVLWTGGTTGHKAGGSYGVFWFEGRLVLAHRWIYEQEVGPIPEGLVLDHVVCDNRGCVNPRHVRPVTVRENTLRGTSPSAQAARRSAERGYSARKVAKAMEA